ncbi:MAG TPA: nuclear transport factor 2 family protein [Balneolaceae bacterium]|nr:nuclear transport factor 2 family protein [Balneolaceae bacterium]
MKTILLNLLMIAFLTIPLSAQEAPDARELTNLLEHFLDGASENNIQIHERFWADDLIYTSSSGVRMTKKDILEGLKNSPSPDQQESSHVYSAEDIQIQQYGTTAVVAFRLVAVTGKGEKKEISEYLNSGTFLNRDGRWQVVNWQATKVP